MPALWSLKCSRVAAISISLAPATDRKLDWVQSGGVIRLTSVNLSLYWVPFGTAQRLKIITFIPGKAGMGATACFLIKYAKKHFGVWYMCVCVWGCNNVFKSTALWRLWVSLSKIGLDDVQQKRVPSCMHESENQLLIWFAAAILMINPCNSCYNEQPARLPCLSEKIPFCFKIYGSALRRASIQKKTQRMGDEDRSPWTLKLLLKARQRKDVKEMEQCGWKTKKAWFNAAGLSTHRYFSSPTRLSCLRCAWIQS